MVGWRATAAPGEPLPGDGIMPALPARASVALNRFIDGSLPGTGPKRPRW